MQRQKRSKIAGRSSHAAVTESQQAPIWVNVHQALCWALTGFSSGTEVVTYRELKSICSGGFFLKSPLCGEYEYFSEMICQKGNRTLTAPFTSQESVSAPPPIIMSLNCLKILHSHG